MPSGYCVQQSRSNRALVQISENEVIMCQKQGRARSNFRNSPNFRCTHPANGGRQVTKLPGNRSISISRYLKHILLFSNSTFFERKIILKIGKNRKNPRFHSKYQAYTMVNPRLTVWFSKIVVNKVCTPVPMLRMLRLTLYYIQMMFIYFLLAKFSEF